MAASTEVLFIDLSGIAHQIWHVSGSEPDPNYVSIQTLARVRALASNHPHAAVCCDAGKSFRAELDPAYKANRDQENRAPLHHQIRLAEDALKRDGFAVWKVPGFEADDIIATGTVKALAVDDDTTVLIATADKDLLQLVSPRVKVKNTGTGPNAGTVADEAVVIAKFGVTPTQMHDWLCLVGDTSDNVKGAKGIGPKNATTLLAAHGSLDAIFAAMDKGLVPGMTIGIRTSLQEFRERWPTVSKLIALRFDVPIEFSDIASERTAPPMEDAVTDKTLTEMTDAEFAQAEGLDANPALSAMREMTGAEATAALGAATAKAAERIMGSGVADGTRAVGRVVAEQPAPVSTAPVDFSQQLEPRTMTEAVQLAQRLFDSKLALGAYGAPQAVLAVILAGREIGLPAMASLRAFHIIEGKPTLSAGIIQSLVLKSGKARYFRCAERTDERATFETQRGDDPASSLSYTMAEAERAGLVKDKGGWKKNPADMLVARASSKLARLVYPDVVSGLYAPEEME